MTKHDLWLSVLRKTKRLPPENTPDGENAEAIADAIRINALQDVIAGKHDNRPVSFGKAFEVVYGERLKL